MSRQQHRYRPKTCAVSYQGTSTVDTNDTRYHTIPRQAPALPLEAFLSRSASELRTPTAKLSGCDFRSSKKGRALGRRCNTHYNAADYATSMHDGPVCANECVRCCALQDSRSTPPRQIITRNATQTRNKDIPVGLKIACAHSPFLYYWTVTDLAKVGPLRAWVGFVVLSTAISHPQNKSLRYHIYMCWHACSCEHHNHPRVRDAQIYIPIPGARGQESNPKY